MPVHRIPISGPFGSTTALMALPPDGPPRAAVLVLHSWWGVGDDVAAIVEGLGDAGFAALCADVLDGRRPETVEEAAIGIAGPPGFSDTTAILHAGAGHLARAATLPVTAAVGFSMGAAWAMWAAFGGVPGVGRAVCYYGGEERPVPGDGRGVPVPRRQRGRLRPADPAARAAALADRRRRLGARARVRRLRPLVRGAGAPRARCGRRGARVGADARVPGRAGRRVAAAPPGAGQRDARRTVRGPHETPADSHMSCDPRVSRVR